ncbi:helix-turn-helix domain-containing protein [Rhizobacter sp. Root1221]|uniref:helix-turn-helix domain-containing protein n=1 Tax=Rhizobacter sp. Root1221 TaxID=1736433 RepID=UPI0006F40CA4|nr:helix-turn-helix domain-containing protein [Rhizobacter sp. Root1221]KQV91752.1 hypothetical protein ASC87_06675 [Rhizobacter sp. Root1221]
MGHPFSDRTFRRFDPEALRAVVHQSDIEHRLLGAGELEIRVRNRVGPQFAVDAGDYGCAVYAQGVLPRQALTIGLAPFRRGLVFTNGRPLAADALQVFAEGATVDYVTTHGAHWRAVTVTRDHLQAHAVRRLGRELVLPATGCEQFEPDPVMTLQLIEQIEAGYRLAADPATDPGTMLLCDMGLLDALTEALAHGPGSPEPRGARTRRRILGALESVVRLGAQSAEVDAATLSRLCAASERLVEQAMRQGAGMPPKRWLTMARFNRVYAELSDPGSTRSVTDTAMHWGFNHLGRFASNYRAVFAESPSDTVARVRGPHRTRVTPCGTVSAA